MGIILEFRFQILDDRNKSKLMNAPQVFLINPRSKIPIPKSKKEVTCR
jgi:hypothetical protein